ncbi:MAG: hypothetical protein A2W61_04750 [Deltaproteobacteria bacterium RIFCSPLOWO2_01_44_7]|nr:MAG: hypothetical protein A2712_08680 [Deltaproteobacteria bacterium RIFCSPHIGHO2_01_FULL_43_49]OGQ14588.1 MAG: hypothetical protein A3D22_08320 [Deltaproteobacteria bacterium RIFCSPHIGHO2_02_FULL_44_53]OGQ27974.1 MAG: hypothetical protein A3D98_07030 [Deltaproteobacteria bacterium RIFCSPHIGHO2_12_FULL_44_21]OGQ31186.1 MAG: hypothetical protein A2979_07080 [Deltaproteobacteria bacterium RIFCSPLOWO2_01_FULL_45_74]OGQ42728.1 MAG: hypothetical protein A2W61_04750 [Deltaproteobacteria bacterium 
MNREKAKQITRAMKALVQKDPRFTINEVRIIVALERIIARLSRSKDLASHLVYKGGFVLLKSYENLRFTRDADVLAIAISKDKLKNLVCAALDVDLDDGLWFGNLQIQELTEQGEYGAYRFDCAFQIGEPDLKKLHKFSRIHVDIGFNDRLPLIPENQRMLSVLEYEEPVTWKIYPLEYIVAEKIHTLFDRGSANSRAKDIYDLIYLSSRYQNQEALVSAIKKTFENRGTAFPESFVQQVSQFDKTILNGAWPSIKALDEKVEFDKAWKMLTNYLRSLDEHFQKS